jgi:tetratricopeptide (TPR) repeat protein
LLEDLGQWAAAAEYRHALGLREGLARAFPAVPQYRADLATSSINFGHLLREQGRAVEALAWYAKAPPLLEVNLHQESRAATSRLLLCNAHQGRAQALGTLGRYADAVAAWDLALTSNDNPHLEAQFQSRRAAALVAAGLARDLTWPLLWGWQR